MADTKANDELNERLDAFLALGQEDNKAWSALARDAEDYIFGNQLRGVDKRDGWDRIVANYLFPAVTQQMALMAQRRPAVVVEPWEPDDAPFADFWRGLEQYRFDRTLRMNILGLGATLDAAIHGFYVAKAYWEPKAEWVADEHRWRGEPRVRLMRPDYFGMDPDNETTTASDASFVYCHRRALLDKVLARWADKAEEIKREAREGPEDLAMPGMATFGGEFEHRAEGQTDPGPAGKTEGRLVSLLRAARGYGEGGQAQGAGGRGEDGLPRWVTVTEVFFRDGKERSGRETRPVPFEELLQQGLVTYDEELMVYRVGTEGVFEGKMVGEPLTMQDSLPEQVVREWKDEPVWPNGRVVLRIGKLILNPDAEKPWDEGGQVWPFRSWPYLVGVNQILPHVWRGLNAAEMPRTLQDWKNVAFAHMANYIKFFGDPIAIVEEGAVAGAGKDEKKLAKKLRARAGAIWLAAKGGLDKIRRDPPPPMSRGILDIDALISRELQDQTGMQEVARGRQGKGQVTATEVQELSRSSRVRTSLAAILQDDWMEGVMRFVAEMDQRYLEPNDMVRIVGKRAAMQMAQAGQGMRADGNDVKFDLSLKIGTALPFDQERRKEEMAELFKAVGPAILPELLAAFGVENAEEVLARSEMWQAFQQFQEMQAAAAQRAEVSAGHGRSRTPAREKGS
ncbi:MAG TPA: hypothetical protein VMY35_14400 [Phycisphaerae bacterium]|nr:hypothetical protein [Phycisphaerae bacterium]